MASFATIATALALIIALTALLAWQSRRLKQTRAQFALVLQHMKEGLVVLNPDRTIALMNTLGSRLIAVPAENPTYDVVESQFEAFSTDGALLPLDQWPSARALRGDFVTDCCLSYRNKATGEIGSRRITTAPVPPGAGQPGQVIITYRDDTERQRMDEARSRLATIVESSEDAILSVSIGGRISSWNKGAEKITGYTSEEMIGQSIKKIFPPEGLPRDTERLQRILAGEHVEPFESDRITKSGRIIRVNISLSPLRSPDGKLTGVSAILRDITETRSLERQLQQSQKMEAIGQLTGRVAHDFNNLLAIVIGNLDLLEMQLPGQAAALHRIHTAQKASTRCADLTRRLLAFSSNQQLVPAPTHVDHSIRNTLELAGHALGPDINITASLRPDLPLVLVDAAGLEGALLNLAINARDAMPEGGCLQIATDLVTFDTDDPQVLSDRLKPGSYAVIAVSDNGHGMSRETQERVFEPFFTTKERGRGTGLGLAIVYGFARQSHGSVSIYSEVGLGTTVSLFLPLADQPIDAVSIKAPDAAAAQVTGTILLVDDEPDLLHITSAYLNKIGYHTLIAADPAHALRIINDSPAIDLMLTDVIMPGGINGIELAKTVRNLRPSIKIMYASGFPADELGHRNLILDGTTLLNKPFRLSELSKAIRKALDTPNTA